MIELMTVHPPSHLPRRTEQLLGGILHNSLLLTQQL